MTRAQHLREKSLGSSPRCEKQHVGAAGVVRQPGSVSGWKRQEFFDGRLVSFRDGHLKLTTASIDQVRNICSFGFGEEKEGVRDRESEVTEKKRAEEDECEWSEKRNSSLLKNEGKR